MDVSTTTRTYTDAEYEKQIKAAAYLEIISLITSTQIEGASKVEEIVEDMSVIRIIINEAKDRGYI